MDHKSVAERVLQDVGGVDNIRAAAPFGLLALYSCDHPQSKGSKTCELDLEHPKQGGLMY